jgi:phage protein D
MSNDTEKLTPGFVIYVNGVRLPPFIEMAVKHIKVTGRINSMSSFSISIADPERIIVDSPLLFIGVQVKILMGYKDAVEEVAIYEITGMRAYFNSESGISVTIEGYCHLQRLNHARVNRGYNEKNMADIANEIAGLYTLSAETDVETEPFPFKLQRNQTDFEYLLMQTREHNCYLWGYDKTVYFKKETDSGKEEIILEKGKTLTAFTGGAQSGKLFTNVVVRGRNPDTGKFIEATAGPDKVKKKIGGNTTAPTHIEKNIAKFTHNYFDYGIKDIKGAEDRAAIILEQNSMDYVRFVGECQGNPKIRAGMTITIKGMGEIYSGKYLVMQAEHELIPMQGYMTSFEVVRNSTLARKEKKQWVPATDRPKKKAKGKLKPEFSNLQWLDKDGKSIKKAMVGDEITLSASAKNVEKGNSVTIKIYEKDNDNPDDLIDEISGEVKNGKVTGKWVFEYNEDNDDVNSNEEKDKKGYTKPEYVFTVENSDGTVVSKKGPVIEMIDWLIINLKDAAGEPLENVECTVKLADGSEVKGCTDLTGKLEIKEIPPGKVNIHTGKLKFEFTVE